MYKKDYMKEKLVQPEKRYKEKKLSYFENWVCV